MKKFRNLKLLGLVGVIVLALVFVGINVVQAQVKAKGKPPGKGKPPKITCNNNDICEYGEYDYNLEHESQPCDDCKLKDYDSLQIIQETGLQIVGLNGNQSIDKVFQFKFESQQYQDTWASKIMNDGYLFYADIVDLNSDGGKKIIALTQYQYQYKEGKGKKAKNYYYYDCKIFMFENDSDGEPDYKSEHFGYANRQVRHVLIADVNNNGLDELILDKCRWIEIYEWNGNNFELIWTSPEYDHLIFSVDVGDADNDGENELVLAMFDIGAPIIWKYKYIDGTETWEWEEKMAEPIDVLNKGIPFLGIDVAKVRDADNVTDEFGNRDNEIIAGGNNNRLMVWKYDKFLDEYKSVFISDDLGGFTPAVEAGDVNDDGDNEIIVGTQHPEYFLYVFKLVFNNGDSPTYELLPIYSMLRDCGLSKLTLGNLDVDEADEIFAHGRDGMTVYDFVEGQLEKTYSTIYGCYPRIK